MNIMKCTVLFLSSLMITGLLMFPESVQGQSREELEQRIRELEERQRDAQEQRRTTTGQTRRSGSSLEDVIERYERLLDGCSQRRSDRCADVMFTLGSLYYDQARDEFIRARERYETEMDEWERRPVGPQPVDPRPDYSKPIQMYRRLVEEYPEFSRASEAYYQIGNINLIGANFDESREWFLRLVERFPNDPRASAAYFRLADFEYLEHNNMQALRYLKEIRRNEIDPRTWEMVHYRKAEIYYNIGDFDRAVELFHSYVEECDSGRYGRQDFRDMALEFMAISFSDMADGAQEALDYFRKVGDRPYIADVLYMIGEKNYTHGQFDDAINALTIALERYPMHAQAPIAQQYLIESFVIKREAERANVERERLVDDYKPGSQWHSMNRNERVVIDKANEAMKNALGNIAIYYHARAQNRRERSYYEKAKQRYLEFFERFPDEKWKIYEFRYNLAEIYSHLGDYVNAAENYDFVARQDLSTYPEFRESIDTLGMDPEELARRRSEMGDATSPIEISQEDAAFNVIVALDNNRKRTMAAEGMNDEQAYSLRETRDLINYVDTFVERFPTSENAADVLYLAANIHYESKAYDMAIATFKRIVEEYSETEIAPMAMRMMANSYSFAGQYDRALSSYNTLLSRAEPGTTEYDQIIDLAAGSIYRHAEAQRERRDYSGAAEIFMSIREHYPTSNVADHGWLEAAISYEEANDYPAAARTFAKMGEYFPNSELLKGAFVRSAENFKKADMYEEAAKVYLAAADQIDDSEYAISRLSNASDAYLQLHMYDMAGKMYKLVFERYPDNEKTPPALYNAGLIFEKGDHYQEAINTYNILVENYADNEFASEAMFSIGLCYENLGENEKMAEVFSKFAQTYSHDRYQQVQALTRAGDAFFELKRFSDAERNYLKATEVYEEYKETADIDVENIARAFYRIGQIYYNRFMEIELTARNEREMQRVINQKTEALAKPAQYFARAIELGIREWTVRSTYMVGQGFVDMAEAVANQTLFGSADQQIAGKIQVLMTLEPYYLRAQDYFLQNIEWAKTQNFTGEYINKSMDRYMEMAYRLGHILEEVGITFKNAPIPDELDEDEREVYRQILEERYLESLDHALPKYEEGIMAAAEIGIAESPWVETIKDRIRYIHPGSEVFGVEIVQWTPEVDPVASSEFGIDDHEFERNMRRIQNIMNRDIPVEDKISQLNRIETEARRNISVEEERIRVLRGS
ncbi:TPR-domain containing protein [Chitinispirillum alkaliphilum]|nr:TPR-domain containing protein [Chitinispirillum alkaliphilum]